MQKILPLIAGVFLGAVFTYTLPALFAESSEEDALKVIIANQEKQIELLKRTPKYEYKVLRVAQRNINYKIAQRLLNKEGRNGWFLLQSAYDDKYNIFILQKVHY